MDRTDPLPPEIELAQLLQRCAAQDSAAFRTLYDKTSPILFARLLRMLRRRSVAEEALQDVYVRIWERAAQYQAHRGRALAWMVTIARYCAIDLMRRERLTLVGDDALAQVADEGTAEPGDFDKPNNFDECIGLLAENTRRCLTLAFVEGRSHDEIARLTQNPLGSVKSWIRRGLQQSQGLPVRREADRMKAGNRELVDRLAAEYVLGTLRGGARRHFERWLVSPQVLQMVNAWETRLAGLEPPLEKVMPPTAVWRGIESRLELARPGRGRAVRWMALAASVVLAVFGYFMLATTGCDEPRNDRLIRPMPRLSTGASSCSATTRSCACRCSHRMRWMPARRSSCGSCRPRAIRYPLACCRPAVSSVASSAPRSAPRSPGPSNWRSAWSPREARPPGFRPGRFCTSHPCLQPEWPPSSRSC